MGVLPKDQAAYVVEGESKQEVLEVHGLALMLGRGQDGPEPVLDGWADPASHGLA